MISAAIPTFSPVNSPVNRSEALNTPAQHFRLRNFCPIEIKRLNRLIMGVVQGADHRLIQATIAECRLGDTYRPQASQQFLEFRPTAAAVGARPGVETKRPYILRQTFFDHAR